MSQYDKTKFYWLQLKEDFFDEDAIDWLEEQPHGKEYSLFYLKLCLKSLRTNGILIRKVGNMLVPYDHVKLGELTKTNPDTVVVAMKLLTQIGLVKVLDNGEFYLTQVEDMIGSQSKGAFKKEQQRLTQKDNKLIVSGQVGDKCPPKIDIEQELEIDKELEKKEINKEKKLTDTQEIQKIIDDNFKYNNELYEAYNEFNKMRSKNKKVSNTPYANKKIINELNKMTDDDEEKIAIINQSIINGWGGIFPVKKNNYNNSYHNNRPSTIAGASTNKSNFKVELPKMSEEELHKYDGMTDDDFNF